ncbi:anthranilate phosphoribosyltransferase [Actinospongicola halichondriae]|uniref:anthranilate phosphoribosyltransferase n=1 Tax=Actinospongicola halichondriae TaxID=3236844 RepID=UPI003D393572
MQTITDVGGWPTLLGRLVDGRDLTADEAGVALTAILAGDATGAQTAGFIVALRQKGETVDELAGLVGAMLDAAAPLDLPPGTIDIVGTGGSPRRRTRALNVSTMSSIVAASAGATVCKHGNVKASSTSGSFDLLTELGVNFDLPPERVGEIVREVGVGFCFARAFHPAMRHAGPVRAELGIPTVFNVLGPLSHPGRVRRQVLGVGDPRLLDLVAGVLATRGAEHALVVHGADHLDELSLCGPTFVREVRDGEIVGSYEVDPAAFGLTVMAEDDMPGGTPGENAAIARSVFAGDQGPARDIVTLNSGAGLFVAGIVDSLADGVDAARAAIDAGSAATTLERLVTVSA